mgnify:CR=1 FL=1
MPIYTDEQAEAVRSALAEHSRVEAVSKDVQPGLMGHNIPILLSDPSDYGFRFHVEDVELNAVFSIVTIESPKYQSDFPDRRHDDVLYAVVEVRRWPRG